MFKNQNLKEVNDQLEELRFKTKVVEYTYNDLDYRFEKTYSEVWRVFIRDVDGWKFETYLIRSGDESGQTLFEDHMDTQLGTLIKESRKRRLHR